jgi:ribosomal protein S4
MRDSYLGRPEFAHLPALLCDLELAGSRSAARRVLAQGAVKINGEVVRDQDAVVEPGDRISVGKSTEAVL